MWRHWLGPQRALARMRLIWRTMVNQLIDPEALGAWKAHPLTVEFLTYLRDRQQALMELWGRGQPMGPEWQREASLLGSILHLQSEEIATFYEVERDEQQRD